MKRARELCQWCGHPVSTRMRDTGFCTHRCAKKQAKADVESAASEREYVEQQDAAAPANSEASR